MIFFYWRERKKRIEIHHLLSSSLQSIFYLIYNITHRLGLIDQQLSVLRHFLILDKKFYLTIT